jgi:hypothetical protein
MEPNKSTPPTKIYFGNICNNREDDLWAWRFPQFRHVICPTKLNALIRSESDTLFMFCEVLSSTVKAICDEFPRAIFSPYHVQHNDDGAHRFVVVPPEGDDIIRSELLPLVDPKKIEGFNMNESESLFETLVRLREFLKTYDRTKLKKLTEEYAYKSVLWVQLLNGRFIAITHTGQRMSKIGQWEILRNLMLEKSIDIIVGDFNCFNPLKRKTLLEEFRHLLASNGLRAHVSFLINTYNPLPWDDLEMSEEMRKRKSQIFSQDGSVREGCEDLVSEWINDAVRIYEENKFLPGIARDNIITHAEIESTTHTFPDRNGDHHHIRSLCYLDS